MNAMSEAIINLEKISEALEKFANKQENYNSPYAQYLEQMSFEMYKMKNDLSEINYMCGGF
jgi:hypothetical protein